jgi:L,D-peptidoglycan transpeptidase YkuD (ErfK/YbiS/YcfS/YnhG family)
MRRSMAFFSIFFFVTCAVRASDDELAAPAKQLVVCIAPVSTASEGTLQLFHRDDAGDWQPDGGRSPVMFARGGLAWGRGVHPSQSGAQKRTGDHRNPAGLFKLGPALGYAPTLPDGAAGWPYHQVTDHDAWIDDPHLPDFNHLVTLPPGAPLPSWWDREHMHLGDFAYQWMVIIEHNYDSPEPDAGNSIFFHVRRGEHYRTAGCTTMAQDDLVRLIKWLRPGSNAMMVELTRADYARFWKDWNLPEPDKALK